MRVNVDSGVFTDARFKLVARRTGLSLHDVIGKCVHIWMACYDQRKGTLRSIEGDCLVDHDGFMEAMCVERLAEVVEGRVEIKGFKQRAEWLKQAEKSGRAGGLKSAELRRKKVEGYPSENPRVPSRVAEGIPQGSLNPLTLTLPLTLSLTPDQDQDPDPDQKENAATSAAPLPPAKKKLHQPLAFWRPGIYTSLRSKPNTGKRRSSLPERARLFPSC